MFSKNFDPLKIKQLLEKNISNVTEVKSILSASMISEKDIPKLLLAYENKPARELILKKAIQTRKTIWHNKLFLLPPLYLSTGDPQKKGCLDHCLYCPWRRGSIPKTKLKRLSISETESEAKILLAMGYKDIELVSATDPVFMDAKKASIYISAVKKIGAKNIGINFFPLNSPANYHELANAGCTFSIVWQETYCADTYRKMHPYGPKSKMNYRLDAHDRALLGGIKIVGVAFLGGLKDWKYEALSTIAHAMYLRKEYNAQIIFGMPRLKGKFISCENYPDEAYQFVGAIYSLVFPESLPWFSTREHFSLSAKAAQGGGCIFTLDCSTKVGGYSKMEGFAQFPVYSKSFSEGTSWLKKLGFIPKITLPWKNKGE